MNARPVRIRLTALYTAILAGMFAATGGGAWFAVRATIYRTVDADLSARMQVVRQYLEGEGRQAGEKALAVEFEEQAAASPAGTTFRFASSDGARKFESSPRRAAESYRSLKANVASGEAEIAIPVGAYETLLADLRLTLLIASPLVLACAFGVGYWLSGRALERLEAGFRRVTQFTADASHELRTPVAVIRTTAELARSQERSGDEYRRALDQILKQSERTSTLIEDLMILARADLGQPDAPFSDADLAEAVRDACSEASVLADAAGVRFEFSTPDRLPVRGDAESLRRLVLILLDNAIKYTPRGGSVTARLTGDRCIAVRDTGVGIAESELPRIFDRFYRVSKDRSRQTGGSGLGLAIAQWIASKHGARIDVQSELGQGSEFRVQFP